MENPDFGEHFSFPLFDLIELINLKNILLVNSLKSSSDPSPCSLVANSTPGTVWLNANYLLAPLGQRGVTDEDQGRDDYHHHHHRRPVITSNHVL